MFGLLQRWRNHRRNKKRLLFSYWDGTRTRRGDPFKLWRDLQNDPTVDIDTAAPAVDEGKEPETTLVVTAIAKAFGVKRLNRETGLSDWELLNLFGDLSTYLLDIKKKYSPGQTPPPPMAPTSSTTTADPDEITKPCSDSYLTPDEKKPDENV